VNAEASGECAATDQEQGRECECELSHCWMIQRAICREKLPQKGIAPSDPALLLQGQDACRRND
jgi:hypothetical protein